VKKVLIVMLLARAAAADEGLYLLPHPDARWWLSGQLNLVAQFHPGFPAAYSGPNSLPTPAEGALSFVASVYGALAVGPTTEVLLHVESAGGNGLGGALGVAGFTNLDVVRNPTLGAAPYLARAELHQVIPLSSEWVDVERGPFRAFSRLPVRRLEIHAGKLGTVDFFDVNEVGGDSHFGFLNWAVDNAGAYDYAADTRGYTIGAVVEYISPEVIVRYGEMLMPTVANGIDYDTDWPTARGEQLELELHWATGVVRVLGFLNHANMGSYAEAIDAFRSGQDAQPDITAHRMPGRVKGGAELNVLQELGEAVRVFGRFSWNDGATESFAYTEIDDSFELGFDVRRGRWRGGMAVATNGLSKDHRTYLALGGQGFLLGDGALDYGRENIVEAFGTVRAWRGVFPALDVQVVQNPGYNRARGPVVVGSVRLHLEL
jgi:hypothetical protein